jgi:hypothetical protein
MASEPSSQPLQQAWALPQHEIYWQPVHLLQFVVAMQTV